MIRSRIRLLLDMQYSMNAKVNTNWLSAGYPWLRAVIIEGAEAMEHYGWKWWKKQDCDVEQLRIELVDIFHFALSDALVHHNGDFEATTNWLAHAMSLPHDAISIGRTEYRLSGAGVIEKLELMIQLAADRRFSFPLFASLLGDVGMTWDDLFTGYVSKNVLNMFRQDHGYKTGTYRKDWGGAEDNVRLAAIVKTLDANSASYAVDLYSALESYYKALPPVELPL